MRGSYELLNRLIISANSMKKQLLAEESEDNMPKVTRTVASCGRAKRALLKDWES